MVGVFPAATLTQHCLFVF